MTYKEDSRYFSNRTDARIKCRCGNYNVIPSYVEKMICPGCGNYVFKDKKEQFKHSLKEKMKSVGN